MARALVCLLCLAAATAATAGCRFAPSGDGGADAVADDGASAPDGPGPDSATIDSATIDSATIDGTPIDSALIDARIDAATDAPTDAAIDAPGCPTAPNGCTAFLCANSSSCYYLCTAQSWTTARDRCTQASIGCLATINSAAENSCIDAVANPTFPNLLWIGWHQDPGGQEPAGGWGWECGTSAFVAGNWGDFEPNNGGGNEDCGAMGSDGAWIDGSCSTSLRFVCEL